VTDTESRTNLVHVIIDGRELEVPKGTLVIRAAEKLGITVPRFCDHPLLDPLGACRQCMVEIEGQRKPFTSCTTTCTEGMVVKTHRTSEVALKAQEGQLEFLLINHPLDCPQCDKGGECPLQDQTLAHGPAGSRFHDDKRRYQKPIPISAQVALDRERCVLCARCTRFSSEIAGDPFIELFERGALEQVAIYEDEPYSSYFSGNVVQICPVGALTASSYRFKARPFDLTSHPSVCNQCSAGCNLRVDVRRGEIQRQLAAENMAVNEMWSCDKGRFGYEFVAAGDRLRTPAVRDEVEGLHATSWAAALHKAADGLQAAIDSDGPQAVGVLTGGRLTDEDAYALSRFSRDVLGTDNVDFRLRPRTVEERDVLSAVAGSVGPTYDDVERADVVVVAGLEPQEEVPILYLRLRKAWRRSRQKIVVVGPVLGSLSEIAWRWVQTAAGGEADALDALARPGTADGSGHPGDIDDVVEALAAAGQRVVVLAGERLAASGGALRAAGRLASERDIAFAWVPRRNGARGALDAGLVPGLLPGGRKASAAGPVGQVWRRLPDTPGMDTTEMLQAAADGRLKALYLVGVDPVRDFEDPRLARAALECADTVIVQDLLPTQTIEFADVVFPAMSAQERVGSFTTWEGRRQPFASVVPAQGLAQLDWDIIRQLALTMGTDLGWETAADVRREAAPLMEVPVRATERLRALGDPHPQPVDRPSRDEGSFDVVVVDSLLGDGTMLLGAKALKETAAPVTVWVNAEDARRIGLAQGSHVRLTGDAGSVELPAKVTTDVAPGVVVVPGPSSGLAAATLVAPGAVLHVGLEPLDQASDRVSDPTSSSEAVGQ